MSSSVANLTSVSYTAKSNNNSMIGFVSQDGTVRFYDTSVSLLKTEFTPSSHLNTACTCLTWAPKSRLKQGVSKKKRRRTSSNIKSSDGEEANNDDPVIDSELKSLDLVAIGTTSGNILLFSVSKGKMHSELHGGHTSKVNSICWSTSQQDVIYSCSDDKHICEWTISTGILKQRWKASKSGPVTALAFDNKNHYLLSASKDIVIWNTKNKEKLKILTGHSSNIKQFYIYDELTEENEYSLLFSSAENDRILCCWKILPSSTDEEEIDSSTACVSLALTESIISFSVCALTDDKNRLLTIVLSQIGKLYVFELKLNKLKKTKPKTIIEIVSPTNNNIQLPILCSYALGTSEILISYGTILKPKFEYLTLDYTQSQQILKREDPSRSTISAEEQVTLIKNATKPTNATVLTQTISQPNMLNKQQITKRPATEIIQTEIPLSERLNAVELHEQNSQIPAADSLVTLLSQGLQSGDKAILEQALTFRNDKLIQKTVRLLSLQSILPLLEHLNNCLHETAEKGLIASKWLRVVLSTHTSYLMTCPDISERLGPMYELIEARTRLYPKLSRLHGKLMLIASQMTTQNDILTTDEISSRPKLIFEELSDEDDDQVEDDIVPSPSEYEDYSGLSDDLDLLNDEEDDDENFDEEEDKLEKNNDSDNEEMLLENDDTLFNHKSNYINHLSNNNNNNKHNGSDFEDNEDEEDIK